MFSTFKQRLILGIYIFLVVSIPIGAYLASNINNQDLNTKATEQDREVNLEDNSTLTPLEELKTLLASPPPSVETSPDPMPVAATTFGPTLNLKLLLEARPVGSYGSRVFVGIADGQTQNSTPNYVLSFSMDKIDEGMRYSAEFGRELTPPFMEKLARRHLG